MKRLIFNFIILAIMISSSCHGQRNSYKSDNDSMQFAKISDSVIQVKYFYPNGSLKSLFYMDKDKKLNGKYIDYWTNGKPSGEFNYSHGLRSGDRFMWFENGKILIEEHYENDLLNGEKTYYSQNGAIYFHEIYLRGKMIKKTYTDEYKKDQQDYLFKNFLESGLDSADALRAAKDQISQLDTLK